MCSEAIRHRRSVRERSHACHRGRRETPSGRAPRASYSLAVTVRRRHPCRSGPCGALSARFVQPPQGTWPWLFALIAHARAAARRRAPARASSTRGEAGRFASSGAGAASGASGVGDSGATGVSGSSGAAGAQTGTGTGPDAGSGQTTTTGQVEERSGPPVEVSPTCFDVPSATMGLCEFAAQCTAAAYHRRARTSRSQRATGFSCATDATGAITGCVR